MWVTSDRSGVFTSNYMGDRNFGSVGEFEELRELLTVERLGSYFQASSGDLLGASIRLI